jgi:hypothetical protein
MRKLTDITIKKNGKVEEWTTERRKGDEIMKFEQETRKK